jgi:hypothetical protein
MKTTRLAALGALASALSLAAQAGPTSVFGGTLGDLQWTAQSTIVAVNSTATATAGSGGDARYFARQPEHSGVVALIMDYGSAGSFICSGTLLSDRRSVLTAAHCVSDGPNTANPLRTTAYFYGGLDGDLQVPWSPLSTAIGVSNYFVHGAYTGQVIDQNDIAVLRLDSDAPSFANGHELYTESDLIGRQFNVAGYGGRSSVGGNLGVDLGTGRLRQGDNRYDFRLGDAAFDGFFNGFFGSADSSYSYLADFDNGLSANDASCRLGAAFGAATAQFCNLGLGWSEASVGGGDSGGPEFIDGKLASVTSYGLSFGTNWGDIRGGLQSSFGEFSGYVPVTLHARFIQSHMLSAQRDSHGVPEPGSVALVLGGLLVAAGSRQRLS